VARVVELHTSAEYEVLAVGFSPGFPYLGPLPQPLRGVRRRAVPRVAVEPGSVGLAGDQTGIYPPTAAGRMGADRPNGC
jgi:allophanate hydrolase subunit 1